MMEKLEEQLKQATRDLHAAEDAFNNAYASYIDTAIYHLYSCEERQKAIVSEIWKQKQTTPPTKRQESLFYQALDKLDYIVQGEWLSSKSKI